jgi:hypothetical protein
MSISLQEGLDVYCNSYSRETQSFRLNSWSSMQGSTVENPKDAEDVFPAAGR